MTDPLVQPVLAAALFGLLGGGKRERPLILHIDDSNLILLTVQAQLKSLGYDAVQALGSEAGIRLALEKKPDLILVDALMPGIDGYETVAHLRAQPPTASTPIIMLTGEDSVRSVDRAMSCGANDYIIKPVKEDRLKAKIETLLKGPNKA